MTEQEFARRAALTFAPIIALKGDIGQATGLAPTAILLPASLLRSRPKAQVLGLPVIWTDERIEPSLVYTPKGGKRQ